MVKRARTLLPISMLLLLLHSYKIMKNSNSLKRAFFLYGHRRRVLVRLFYYVFYAVQFITHKKAHIHNREHGIALLVYIYVIYNKWWTTSQQTNKKVHSPIYKPYDLLVHTYCIHFYIILYSYSTIHIMFFFYFSACYIDRLCRDNRFLTT